MAGRSSPALTVLRWCWTQGRRQRRPSPPPASRAGGPARGGGRGAAGPRGGVLDAKPAGVVLHTRTAADDVAAAATERARALLEQIPGVHLSDGKRVLETSVISADKGQGIELLRAFSGAGAVLFAGDDVTDENAFRVLRGQDVGIKVGPGATAARYRVDSPQAFAGARPRPFAGVLALLAELRAAAAGR